VEASYSRWNLERHVFPRPMSLAGRPCIRSTKYSAVPQLPESRDLDQYKPAHAERRAASGSSTMTSDADRMMRVARRGVS
jgi:hypothetical protein